MSRMNFTPQEVKELNNGLPLFDCNRTHKWGFRQRQYIKLGGVGRRANKKTAKEARSFSFNYVFPDSMHRLQGFRQAA